MAFSPIVNSVERGTNFQLATGSQIRDARFYVGQMPGNLANYQVAAVNLYPSGLEDLTGPIQEVIIPVKTVSVTGTAMNVVGASQYADALYQPGDNKYMTIGYSAAGQQIGMFFDIASYPVLYNKRILNVAFAYAGGVQDYGANFLPIDFVHPPDGTSMTALSQTNDAGNEQQFSGIAFDQGGLGTLYGLNTSPGTSGAAINGATVQYVNLGDINNGWNAASIGSAEKMPWRWSELLRFDPATVASRQFLKLSIGIPLTENGYSPAGSGTRVQMQLGYAALRVIYCEERRVAYGAQQFQYSYGMNPITIREPSGLTADPFIAAGNYLPTLSLVSMGQVGFGFGLNGEAPDMNAVRQLYELPTHPAVELDIPFPLADHIGETFTKQASDILPQLTLHASGGPLSAPHVYGRQAWAQVYGTNFATQEIYDDITGVNAPYPQVRYYARRFGDTTIPLTLTGTGVFAGFSASITVAQFDALPEIIGGAKEVTLRFATAPNLGAATGTPGWTWSAINELSGNRWEVLAASAPAISGITGSQYTLVPSPNQLGGGTYQPPQGATVELTWMPQGVASIWVTGSTIDAATDGVLMFSQDPATVTGHSVSTLTQSVSGIGAFCGGLPCCIASGISYNQITWPMDGSTTLIRDSFDRTAATGLGNPDVGTGPYVLTDVASAYSVNGAEALITPTVAGTYDYATLNVGSPNFDETVMVGTLAALVAGSTARVGLAGRYTDANNTYQAWIQQAQSTGAAVLVIEKVVAGVATLIQVINSPLNIDGGGRVWMRFMGSGTWLKFKVWNGDLDDQPSMWNIELNDSTLTTGNRAGLVAQTRTLTGNTLTFNDLTINSPSYWFGGYELQRWDAATGGDFATIMLATDITTTTFKDFEARVGQASVYRMRKINAYNFNGLWSTYVTGTVPSPGIVGGCSDMTGALIFTSNADQTGNNNAAYIMQWDGIPTENFDLPEADQVQFQSMYGRDGVVAFHGTERGLETFTRTLLVQAGAISLPSLADATDIRDLAWDQLPYVCVRDSRGNRWFANVRIPGVSARNDAQSYLARVAVTETGRTPYPVDP